MHKYKMSKLPKIAHYLLLYTVLFALSSTVIFSHFFRTDTSFVWSNDGQYQTFASLAYFASYWRQALKGLLCGTLSLPMVDFNIGLGFDVLTTLNYYSFGDPLNWISVFFRQDQMEHVYNALVLLRYYLCGLSYSLYCLYLRKKELPTLAGALAYTFCGFALYAGVRHPYFLNAMIYLPLLILGAERILRKKGGLFFSLTVCISAISNFYFFYMLTVLTFLYGLIRYIDLHRGAWKDEFFRTFLRCAGFYLLGVCLSAVCLLPAAVAVLDSSRSGNFVYYAVSKWLYKPEFYGNIFYEFALPAFEADYWIVLTYASVAFFAVIALFTGRQRHYPALKVSFLLLTAMLLCPFAGHVMNGFSYVTHRWVFGFGFLIALTVTVTFDELLNLSWRRLAFMAALAVLFALWVVATGRYGSFGSAAGLLMIFAALLVMISSCAVRLINERKHPFPLPERSLSEQNSPRQSSSERSLPGQHLPGQRDRSKSVPLPIRLSLLGVLLLSVSVNAVCLYTPAGYNYVREFRPAGTVYRDLISCPEAASLLIQDPDFYRIDGRTTAKTNQSLLLRHNGVNAYFSVISRDVVRYLTELEIESVQLPYWFFGLGGRFSLDTLASVKYFVKDGGTGITPPFGFVTAGWAPRIYSETVDTLCVNQYALPLGYTYEQTLGSREIETLSALRKQQVMTQAAILEEEGDSSLSSLTFTETPLPYSLTGTDGLVWNRQEGTLHIPEGGAGFTVVCEENAGSETYMRLEGIDINGSGFDAINVELDCGGYTVPLSLTSEQNPMDTGRKNYLICLGSRGNETGTYRLRFPAGGDFRLKEIQLLSLPLDTCAAQIEELRKEALENIAIRPNHITGSATLTEPRFMCFSIPYGRGWSARVNGKPAELKKANYMYMGLSLERGYSEIELSYCTPGIKAGAVLSAAALLLFIYMAIKNRTERKHGMAGGGQLSGGKRLDKEESSGERDHDHRPLL